MGDFIIMSARPKSLLDTDENKEIRVWLLKMPEITKKLEKLYTIVVGDPVEKVPGLVNDVSDIKKILGVLLRLAWIVVGAFVTFVVGASTAGIVFLVRYAPLLAEINKANP